MCSVRCRALIVTLGLSALPAAAPAQLRAAYERRLDSLAAVYRTANARLVAVRDSLARAGMVRDTVAVGPMRILTDVATAELSRQAGERVVASLTRHYRFLLPHFTTHPLIARRVGRTGFSVGDSAYVAIGAVSMKGEWISTADVPPHLDDVTSTLLRAALGSLSGAVDTSIIRWAGMVPPLDSAPTFIYTRARADMISSHSFTARQCYAGDMKACRLALAITPVADVATEWFNASDRRALIARNDRTGWASIRPETAESCKAGNDSLCIAIIRAHPDVTIGPPLRQMHRVTIVQLAGAIGGEGAYERLLTTPGSLDERIAAAARVPTDSVLRVWTARAKGVELPSDDMSPMIALTSVGWILVCGALALRSSRWK